MELKNKWMMLEKTSRVEKSQKILKLKLKCSKERNWLMLKLDKLHGINNSNCMPLKEMFKIKWLKGKNSEKKHMMNTREKEDKLIQLSIK